MQLWNKLEYKYCKQIMYWKLIEEKDSTRLYLPFFTIGVAKLIG